MPVERGSAQRGQTVSLRIRFEQSGVLADPNSIDSIQILNEALAVIVTIPVGSAVHDGVGRYHVDWGVPNNEPLELHHDRWRVTPVLGASQKTFTLSFFVHDFTASGGAGSYMTVGEIAEYLPDASELSDAQMIALGALAQEIVETRCGQRFLPFEEARVFDGLGKPVQPLDLPIIRDSITKLEFLYGLEWDDVTPSDLAWVRYMKGKKMIGLGNVLSKSQRLGRPRHEPYWQRPSGTCGSFPAGLQNVRITASWGRFAEVPLQIKSAIGLLVKYSGSCDDPAGVPSNPFLSETVAGGRAYVLRVIKRAAATDRTTGYPDVDAILQRFIRGAHVRSL